MDLIYGEVNDGLVFIPRGQAAELALLNDPASGLTWAELRSSVSPERWAQIVDLMTDQGARPMPDATQPFDPEQVPGKAYSDWPEWPAQAMLSWMPADIVMRFGQRQESVINGTFLWLDPGGLDEIVEAMEELGWSCEEDESLVLAASGYV